MHLRMWVAPMGLFLLQTAPVGVEVDSVGRLRLSFGFSGGGYEAQRLSCDGGILDREDVGVSEATAEVEYWAAPSVRTVVYGAVLNTTSERPPEERINRLVAGVHGGILVAWEGRSIGVGGGVATVPRGSADGGDSLSPAFYFRAGKLDGAHFRVETGGAGLPGLTAKVARVGVGFGQGQRRGPSGQFGVGFTPYPSPDGTPIYYGSLLFPLSRTVDIGGAAGIAPRAWNVGLMGRVNLGGPARAASAPD